MWFPKLRRKNIQMKMLKKTIKQEKKSGQQTCRSAPLAQWNYFLNLRAVLGVGDVAGNHRNGTAGMCTFHSPSRAPHTRSSIFSSHFRLTVSITSNESCELSNEKSAAAETLTQ